MIDACVRRDQVRGCSCTGCPVHKGPCPDRELPVEVDIYRILTPHHGEKGNADHHLSNLKAFCQPCNRNTQAPTPSPQHTPHTHAHIDTLRLLEARRDAIRDNPTTSSGQLLNLDHEPEYRRACFGYLLRGAKDPKFRFDRREMKANAREASDTGRDAAYSYQERLFSSQEGPLTDVDPVTGKKGIVRFKDPADYALSLEQLEAKYPKEGRGYRAEASS